MNAYDPAMRATWLMAALLLLILAAPARAAQDRYSIVNGCWALEQGGKRISGKSEALRLQATGLGTYLLYGRDKDFLAVGQGTAVAFDGEPTPSAEWRVDGREGAFTLTNLGTGRKLAVDGGKLVTAGTAAEFAFTGAQGCAVYPEITTDIEGEPFKGPTAFGATRGYLDAHLHMMAFEFLGGKARCGRPWHPYGVAYALVDCPDHEPGGAGAVLENVLSTGSPLGTHDTVGWPTFKDWPAPRSLTHEQIYYKWLERAWRGGLRMFVNLLVDNAALCDLYPYKKNSCNEMDSVRLQLKDIHALEDYIDAQSGGPGKGWFRIVSDPFEARRIINSGKLAVVLGIENSKLFDCGLNNDVPECDRKVIDAQLDEFYKAGVRSLELVNKFDNALAGVAGDGGSTGVVVNGGNKYETGQFWKMQTCGSEYHDHEQYAPARDPFAGAVLQMYLPAGQTPVYPPPPHCNVRGLSDLGEYLIRRMMEKRMIFDPDHLSVLARQQALNVVESERYPGIVSSHSWSTPDAFPRIYDLGGVITPYAGNSTSFVKAWHEVKAVRSNKPFLWGIGYGADMNGFGGQGLPRGADAKDPVQYPFTALGGVKVTKQRSGERVYDINVDGVSHYGLYPDWIEDLRKLAGEEIVDDLQRGPEAYLQMWERTVGVRNRVCRDRKERLTSRGIGGARIGAAADAVLRSDGQPMVRTARAYRYCIAAEPKAHTGVAVVFNPAGRAALVATRARTGRLPRAAKPAGKGLYLRHTRSGRAYVYGVRAGKVWFTGVAARSVAASPSRLRSYVKLAGLRR
jgi:microsomal dipeptidase-like Zn-dependent dipeptidase